MYHRLFVGIVVLEIITLCFGHENQILERYDENSIFYVKHALCEKIASGRHLTDLTCVTMARLPVFGYVKRTTDGDKVSTCWRCGPDVVGVPDTFTEKEVWATAMPAQYLTLDSTDGNVIIGERINATMSSGASVVTDTEHGRVLYLNSTDSCVTADAIRDFMDITVTLRFKMASYTNDKYVKIFEFYSSIHGNKFRLKCQYNNHSVDFRCRARQNSRLWLVIIDRIMLDQWFHLGVTLGPEVGMAMYVDGVRRGESEGDYRPNVLPEAPPKFFVGCNGFWQSQPFGGLIDEVLIWNEILSPEFMKTYFGSN